MSLSREALLFASLLSSQGEHRIKEVEGKRALLEIKEREYNQLVKQLELTRENEATSLTERLVILMCFCHLNFLQFIFED